MTVRVLGIDYGSKRVGWSVSDWDGVTAFPGGLITWKKEDELLREITKLVEDKEAQQVVVGLPLALSGEEGIAARNVLAFAKRLRAALSVPVETFDERLSTARAQRAMVDADVSRAKRAKRVDAVAAALFLQTWLDRRQQGA